MIHATSSSAPGACLQGYNKRATVYYLMRRFEESIQVRAARHVQLVLGCHSACLRRIHSYCPVRMVSEVTLLVCLLCCGRCTYMLLHLAVGNTLACHTHTLLLCDELCLLPDIRCCSLQDCKMVLKMQPWHFGAASGMGLC
jgi:hypothetical protein